jgi:hypothetical protein
MATIRVISEISRGVIGKGKKDGFEGSIGPESVVVDPNELTKAYVQTRDQESQRLPFSKQHVVCEGPAFARPA